MNGLFRTDPILRTPELDRVLALPRRSPGVLADELTQLLRTPGGAQSLRPAQALALFELASARGLFAPIKCGGGKTLVTLLAAQMLDVQRPVLLVPAALRERTARDAMALLSHWQVRLPRIVGYEELGRVAQDKYLEQIGPDMIIADEGHRLANTDAAVTRRVGRYLAAHPECPYADLSGTGIGTDLLRYQHRLVWALGAGAPITRNRGECEQWNAALYPTHVGRAPAIGALRAFGHDPAPGLVRRIRDTHGVVGTEDVGCGASLEIGLWRPELPPALRRLIQQVTLEERRPDGVDLLDDFAGVSATVQQMALGFWYRWDPPAPEAWLAARRDWWRTVREILDQHTDGLDTELQVRQSYPAEAAQWLAIRDTFAPNPVAVWESGDVMDQAAQWAREMRHAGPGIVWTRYRAVGVALESLGVPYHGQHGLDARGVFVESATGPIAASIASCGTGANLQRYARSLVLTIPANAETWEQLISRTHREGQTVDMVRVDVVRAVSQHADALRGARELADQVTAQGDVQRLSMATYIYGVSNGNVCNGRGHEGER